eukprot:gene39532-48193_t
MTSALITTLGSILTATASGAARGVYATAVALAHGPAVLKNVWRSWRNRGPVLRMLEMDDCMLRDIGLTRGDIHSALASPMAIDPSTRLRVMAVERRAGMRAQAKERMAYYQQQERIARDAMASEPRKLALGAW